ncbi:hypothetical protein ACFQO7_32465 [Catellatospora aurea]|uniref:Uncharacterized protein n=1 Tax=Catellatospora aurea TaxID=1337874 RepID=A0ABW2H604_9ACTN
MAMIQEDQVAVATPVKAPHRRRRVFLAVPAMGAVVAVAALVVSGMSGPGADPQGPGGSVAGMETANMRLVAAITATEQSSYKVRTVSKLAYEPGKFNIWRNTAWFDPATRSAAVNPEVIEGLVGQQERLVDGDLYICTVGDGCEKKPGKHDGLTYEYALNGKLGGAASLMSLLDVLREADAKITEDGNKYHFEVTVKSTRAGTNPPQVMLETLTGDITIDADKRIASVAYERVLDSEKPGWEATSYNVVATFSDYGKVTIERPAPNEWVCANPDACRALADEVGRKWL